MRSAQNCAPTRGKVEARGVTKTPDTSNRTAAVAGAQAAKLPAMVLYDAGAVSWHEVVAEFARHPSWRST